MEKLNKKETKQLWEALEMIASMCVSLATGRKLLRLGLANASPAKK